MHEATNSFPDDAADGDEQNKSVDEGAKY